MRTNKKIFLSALISFYLLSFVMGTDVNASAPAFSNIICAKQDYLKAYKTADAASSESIEVDQTVARSFQGNLTGTFQGGLQMSELSSISNTASLTRHLMCRDHDKYYNPIDPTTIFRPSDTKAVCLITVSMEKYDTVDYTWYYRSNSSKTWVHCREADWSYTAQYDGPQFIAGYFYIKGCWPGFYYPRAYKVEVYYLNTSLLFSDFFEVTNGGLNSPRMCEDVDADGHPVNMKSRFTIGVDTKAQHYLSFDKIAYFNEELECCHNFTTVWIQPNGSTYKTHSGSFTDYKDTNVTWNYWKYSRYTPDDNVSINLSTPVGNWKVEVYLDSYFNDTWISYGPIATTRFVVGSEPVADWTFMVYLDADVNKSGTEQSAIEIFLKMANVGSSSRVNVVVQMDRIASKEWWDDTRFDNWTDCRRFYVTEGMTPTLGNATLNLGEVNMGHPDTLKDFVNWTIRYYPANYYFLVLWDHGTGCMGLCFDSSTPPPTDFLSLPELSQALSGLPVIMDAVFLDACSMSMTEIAYQIKDYANVLVGPEGLGWGPAPYDDYLSSLISDSWMSPSAFAEEVVTDYIEWCYPISVVDNATMSATDLTKITSLMAAIADFALKLEGNENFYNYLINLARNQTEGYKGPLSGQSGYYIDLYHFAHLTSQYVRDEELQNTANQMMAALESVVIMEDDKFRPDSHGLSIFFPDEEDKYNNYKSEYEETTFAEDTSWDEFVKYYLHIQTYGYVLTIQTPYRDIRVKVKVDDESYTTDTDGKIRVLILPGSYTINAPTPVSTGLGSRGVFTQWNDSITSNPRTLSINEKSTLEAEYEDQYQLIMHTDFGTTDPPVGQHWYEADSIFNISAIAPSANSGERYVWLRWTGTGSGSYSSTDNPASIIMVGPVNETAVWRHEYYLTVTSIHGSPMPTTGWYEAAEFINASITSPTSETAGTQYVCTGWAGTGNVPMSGTVTYVTFTIGKPSSITWNWKTQYLLVVCTDPVGLNPQPSVSPPGPWYDQGTPVNCTAQQISGYVFDHWNVDGTDMDQGVNPIRVTMDGPHEATTYMRPLAWWESLLPSGMVQIVVGLVGIVVTVALVGTVWVRTRRRKRVMKARAEPVPVEVSEVLPDRVTTGYRDLDNLLFGGIPKNYAVILTSPSCDERDSMIKKILETGVEKGEVTFYVTTDPGELKPLAEEFQSNFYLFICNPQADKIIKSLPNVFKLKGVENLTEIGIALTKAFRSLDSSITGPRRACIEIVSDVLLQHHAVKTRRWLTDIIVELKSRGFTTLAVMNPKMHPSEEVHAILDLFEGEINIYERALEEKFLKIKKMYNQRYSDSEIPLKKEKMETSKK